MSHLDYPVMWSKQEIGHEPVEATAEVAMMQRELGRLRAHEQYLIRELQVLLGEHPGPRPLSPAEAWGECFEQVRRLVESSQT